MKTDHWLPWVLALLGGLSMCGARLGWLLFKVAPHPPEEPLALQLWRLKRRWLVFSEFSALPAFATFSVTIGRLKSWPIEGVIALTMVLGALGFAFFLDALQSLLRRRLNLEDRDD